MYNDLREPIRCLSSFQIQLLLVMNSVMVPTAVRQEHYIERFQFIIWEIVICRCCRWGKIQFDFGHNFHTGPWPLRKYPMAPRFGTPVLEHLVDWMGLYQRTSWDTMYKVRLSDIHCKVHTLVSSTLQVSLTLSLSRDNFARWSTWLPLGTAT